MSASRKTPPPAPLPQRDGVAPSYLWLPEGSWDNMLAFLVQQYPLVSAADWIDRMVRREVVTADGVVLAPDSPYRRGTRIYYYRELEYETPIPFQAQILFQDEHLVVVDKPHFLPMTPTGRFLQETLLVRLKKELDNPDLTPIHRLDRETAGVVIFSSQRASRGAYQALFQQRAVEKVYEALAPPLAGALAAPLAGPLAASLTGALNAPLASALAARTFPFVYRSRMEEGEPFFLMREVPGEPNSETVIDVIEQRGAHTLYRLRPHTGRKHQLRVHLAALGIPIVNDPFYPVALPCKQDDVSQPLQLLARALSFIDPLSGQPRYFESLRSL